VGSETYLYPVQGTNAGWGEEATDWAEAINDVVGTLFGPDDIANTNGVILDNQSTAQTVGSGSSALKFSSATVRSFEVDYVVTRVNVSTYVERGTMSGHYDGTNWTLQVESVGDAGMAFQISSLGVIQYFSDSGKGDGTITYSAKAKQQ